MTQRKDDDRVSNLSRAGFVRSLAFGAAGAAVLATAGKARAGDPPSSLPSLAVAVLTLIGNHPDLPGASAVVAFANATYPARMSADDAVLLRGALYLQCDRLVRGVDALGIDAVTAALSRPIAAIPLASTCFGSILEATRTRAASDRQFAASVRAAARLADQVIANPDVPDSADFLFGLIFGIILVVLIVVVLLE